METAPSTGNNQIQQSICYCWPNNIITEQSIIVAIEREIESKIGAWANQSCLCSKALNYRWRLQSQQFFMINQEGTGIFIK